MLKTVRRKIQQYGGNTIRNYIDQLPGNMFEILYFISLKGTVLCGDGTSSSSCNECHQNTYAISGESCNSIDCFFDSHNNTCENSSEFLYSRLAAPIGISVSF